MINYLFGIRSPIGNDSDYAKITNYGFVYWFDVCNDDELRNYLNYSILLTLQEIQLEELPAQVGVRSVYSNLQIAQPVPAGIGETFTLRYLSLIDVDRGIDIVNNVFYKWMYEKILLKTKGFLVGSVNPLEWTGSCGYVLLSPDLKEIWGGEIFNGVVIEGYSHNMAYTSGSSELRTIEARFRYLERWPVLTNDYSLKWRAELFTFISEIQSHVQGLYTERFL